MNTDITDALAIERQLRYISKYPNVRVAPLDSETQAEAARLIGRLRVGLEESLSYADACRAQAHRLALELECLLLDTKDLSVVSKWWASANEALEGWHATMRAESAAQPADPSVPTNAT